MGDNPSAATTNKKDAGIRAWASKLLSNAGDFIEEATGGNSKKLDVGPGDFIPVDIVFPTFPSGASMQKLAGTYTAKDHPVAHAIVAGLPHMDFQIHYAVPRAVAEQVNEQLARDTFMEWLQPIMAGIEATIAHNVENRQEMFDQMDAGEKAAYLAGLPAYIEQFGDSFMGGLRDNVSAGGKAKLVEIYNRLGANVDASGVANWNFTYKMGTGTIKLVGASVALAGSGVTAGASGVAGVLLVVDAAAGIANAIADKVTAIESVERDVKAELDSLLSTLSANGQGLKDLVAATAFKAAGFAGFGVDNVADLVRNLVRVGNNMGPLGDGIKKAFDAVSGTTESVETRLTLLKAKCGDIQKSANGFINDLNALLQEADSTGQQDAIPQVDGLIKKVIALQEKVKRVDAQIADSDEKLEAFKASLGKWQGAKKFVDVASAMIQLGTGLHDASAAASWEGLKDALSDANIFDTIGKVIDIKEAGEAVKEGLAG